jgi:hypothetical protein
MRRARPLLAFALAIVGAACAPRGPALLYPGPARDPSQIAVIRRPGGGLGLRVLRIDDHNTGGFEWHVAPGPHRIWVELQLFGDAMNVSYKAWMYCPIDFDAVAGGIYRLVSENGQRRQAVDTEVTLGVHVVDAQEEIVGTPGDCSGRRPAFATQ